MMYSLPESAAFHGSFSYGVMELNTSVNEENLPDIYYEWNYLKLTDATAE